AKRDNSAWPKGAKLSGFSNSRAEGIYADIEDKIKGKIWKTNNLTFSFPVFRTKLPHLAIFVVVLY
ncbi:hypothetical protein DXB82_18360, partial [Phocaeicola vulgatus]|uniref:hypothetical protein n=2 Tax=Phocaeicola vulgatus TaxID=821 RepID=UPI000EE25271